MHKKKFLAVMAAAFILFTSFGAFAATTVTKITAQIDSAAKVRLNGNPMSLKAPDGKLTSIISYNGKNYLAADVLSDQLGLAFQFDSKTKTLFLGEKPGKGYLFNKNVVWNYDGHGNNPKAAVTTDKDLLSIGQESPGIGMYAVNPKDLSLGRPSFCAQLILNPNKKYQKIMFKAGSEKSDNQAKVLVVDGKNQNGMVLKEIALTDDQFIDVELDIGSYSTISIYAVGVEGDDYTDEKVVVGDIFFK